mgnify:CR=1 FL=1
MHWYCGCGVWLVMLNLSLIFYTGTTMLNSVPPTCFLLYSTTTVGCSVWSTQQSLDMLFRTRQSRLHINLCPQMCPTSALVAHNNSTLYAHMQGGLPFAQPSTCDFPMIPLFVAIRRFSALDSVLPSHGSLRSPSFADSLQLGLLICQLLRRCLTADTDEQAKIIIKDFNSYKNDEAILYVPSDGIEYIQTMIIR